MHIQGSKRVCALCSGEIAQAQLFDYFPPAVMNEQDPCHSLNGSFLHVACIETCPHRDRIRGFIQRERLFRSQRPYTCRVCHRQIDSPDDFFTTFDFGDDLKEFSYLPFHKACFKKWEFAQTYYSMLEELSTSPWWTSKNLELLRKDATTLLAGHS